jgi:hypothetical protein
MGSNRGRREMESIGGEGTWKVIRRRIWEALKKGRVGYMNERGISEIMEEGMNGNYLEEKGDWKH